MAYDPQAHVKAMSKRNTRAQKSERKRKTIGKEVAVTRRALHIEAEGPDGELHRIAIDCPPDITATRLLLSCTHGVKWYFR